MRRMPMGLRHRLFRRSLRLSSSRLRARSSGHRSKRRAKCSSELLLWPAENSWIACASRTPLAACCAVQGSFAKVTDKLCSLTCTVFGRDVTSLFLVLLLAQTGMLCFTTFSDRRLVVFVLLISFFEEIFVSTLSAVILDTEWSGC